jgi:uncharacterized integral membrane protein
MKPKTIFIIVLLLLFVILIIQNTDVAGFQLYFWKVEMSRAILLPIIFIAGLIIGFFGCLITTKKK